MHGIADLILEDENCVVPVEFKKRMGTLRRGTIYQLTAYGMMAAEKFGKKYEVAFVVADVQPKMHVVRNSLENEKALGKVAEGLRRILETSMLPDSSASEYKCGQCEYLKYCNDRF